MSNQASLETVHRQSHFAPAFFFLSRERRQALETLYAVCRVLDDAVDVAGQSPEAELQEWRKVFTENDATPLTDPSAAALGRKFLEVAQKFNIPLQVMIDLIDKGVAVDLEKNRFQTPMDLEAYCYGVAGTVGLACLPIFGVPIQEAKEFAIRLGIAVQWTNILRDVGVDARMGRIYLPLDHLEQFGYTEKELFERKNTSSFQSLLSYEFGVAKSHYKRARELLPEKWKQQLLPARIMGTIYERLLDKLKAQTYPVLERKIRLNFVEKGLAVISAVRT